MSKLRQVFKGFAALAAVGLICAGVWARLPRERSLLKRAAKISGSDPVTYFCWLNDHEILSVYNSGYTHYHVNSYDVATKAKTHFPTVEKAMDFNMENTIFPSGDGRRFLCPGFDGEPEAHIVSLDTATVTAVKTGDILSFAWFPEAASWMYLVCDTAGDASDKRSLCYAVLINPLKPHDLHTIPVESPNCNVDHDYAPVVAVTPDHRILSVAEAGTVSDWRIQGDKIIAGGQSKFNSAPMKSDDPYSPVCCAINPQGDRIFWIQCVTPPEAFLYQQIQRFLPGRFPLPKGRIEFWSAKLDGSDRKFFWLYRNARRGV